MDYIYEVREGDAVTSTGHLSDDRELQPRDKVRFVEQDAVVREVSFTLSGPARLVLTLRDRR